MDLLSPIASPGIGKSTIEAKANEYSTTANPTLDNRLTCGKSAATKREIREAATENTSKRVWIVVDEDWW